MTYFNADNYWDEIQFNFDSGNTEWDVVHDAWTHFCDGGFGIDGEPDNCNDAYILDDLRNHYINGKAGIIQRWWRQQRELPDEDEDEEDEWDTCERCHAFIKVTYGVTCVGYSIANDDVTDAMCCRACLDNLADARSSK
jgi:hypothetical protein